MEKNLSTYEENVRSFWHRYLEKVQELGVKKPFDRWMVQRAEAYIGVFPVRKLSVSRPQVMSSDICPN